LLVLHIDLKKKISMIKYSKRRTTWCMGH